MESVASPVDRRRQVVLLRVGGFTSLALGLLGSIACIALAVVASVDALGGFQTVDVPGRGVLSLEQRHYVIYYEDTVAVPEAVEVRGLSVSIRPGAWPQNVLPISGYGGSLTYSLGSYHGRAVGTFDTPRPGRYVITTSSTVRRRAQCTDRHRTVRPWPVGPLSAPRRNRRDRRLLRRGGLGSPAPDAFGQGGH